MLLTRTRMLFGDKAMETLSQSKVLLFGLGGVGGSVAEALARSGIGEMHLVDNDTVDESNLNRQLFATKETIGMPKTEAAARRLSLVSDVRLRLFPIFFMPENADAIDFSVYDYVIDAVDTVAAKIAIIEHAQAARVPVITCLGTGNKTDPGKLLISDLYETSVCPLAKVMRHECRKRGLEGIKALWSTETPRKTSPLPDMVLPQGKRSVPASCAFVPNAAGLLIASRVVRDLIERGGNA